MHSQPPPDAAIRAMPEHSRATPMMAQYLSLKAEAPDCLLFMRMGDFFELFFDDAVAAAECLDITLTKRGRHNGEDIPMCGVPCHSADTYLARLIRAGHRVAIAEQVESPEEARKRGGKSLVERRLVRVVTPGTLTDAALLDAREANHLVAIAPGAGSGRVALAWCDVSTGRFGTQLLDPSALEAELARLAPSEILIAEGWTAPLPLPPVPRPASRFDPRRGRDRLCTLLGVLTLDAFGDFAAEELGAAGALVDYLEETGCGAVPRLSPPTRSASSNQMAIDRATRVSLELVRSSAGERSGSLLGCIDMTLTAAGARLLGEHIGAPLLDPLAIDERLSVVAWFFDRPDARAALRLRLRRCPDIERALARLSAGRGSARDLAAVRDALACASAIAGELDGLSELDRPPALARLLSPLAERDPALGVLAEALVAEPPLDMAGGGYIASRFDPELDRLRDSGALGRGAIAELEARYRRQTGIQSLKIRHNNVLGYHIDVPQRASAALADAGAHFVHRQTLAGSMRFVTDEIRQLERDIATASDRSIELERAHFDRLVTAVLDQLDGLRATAAVLAQLDVSASHAEVASRRRWVRPSLDLSGDFCIEGGRHPLVEASLEGRHDRFVANDCDLGAERLWLLTGPNMGGKSTFLRQNALIAVLAQMGSFVPASSARIGIVDRLFSRVGASDNLAQGRSTFMVEMVETAGILAQATERSLVVLDEIGRGTSTYDGLAIAWAVLEALHDRVRCRCLFATHYHELTRLESRLAQLSLHTVRVREWKGDLVFLHEVARGAADRSYGIAVARLAGLPPAVVKRAQAVLARLERGRDRTGGIAAGLDDLPLFASVQDVSSEAPPADAVHERLSGIAPDELTPRTALDLIYELKRLSDQSSGPAR